jgi:hypothetical protein
LKACLIYLDDVIIFSRTYEQHVERLKQVFTRIREAGLKLVPKKCRLFNERVVYVGHQVSREGVAPDPDKTSCIRGWPTPRTPEDVRRFLGFAGYYRKFVKDFAKIASPLSALMPAPVKKRRGRKKTTETPQKHTAVRPPHGRLRYGLKSRIVSAAGKKEQSHRLREQKPRQG